MNMFCSMNGIRYGSAGVIDLQKYSNVNSQVLRKKSRTKKHLFR